jgi:phosphomannomutase
MQVFWDVMLGFGCLFLSGLLDSEDQNATILQTVRKYPMTDASLPETKVHCRRTNVGAYFTLCIDAMLSQENGAPQHIIHVHKQILLAA